MATIKEISQLAEVSITTVSRVLNQDETIVVSPEVKKRIFKIAHELKYVPPRMRHTQKKEKLSLVWLTGTLSARTGQTSGFPPWT